MPAAPVSAELEEGSAAANDGSVPADQGEASIAKTHEAHGGMNIQQPAQVVTNNQSE